MYIALDLIVQLPESQKSYRGKSNDLDLGSVNRFLKVAQYIPVRNTIDAT